MLNFFLKYWKIISFLIFVVIITMVIYAIFNTIFPYEPPYTILKNTTPPDPTQVFPVLEARETIVGNAGRPPAVIPPPLVSEIVSPPETLEGLIGNASNGIVPKQGLTPIEPPHDPYVYTKLAYQSTDMEGNPVDSKVEVYLKSKPRPWYLAFGSGFIAISTFACFLYIY